MKYLILILILLAGCTGIKDIIIKQEYIICPVEKINIPCEKMSKDVRIFETPKQAYDKAKHINNQCYIAVETRDGARDECVKRFKKMISITLQLIVFCLIITTFITGILIIHCKKKNEKCVKTLNLLRKKISSKNTNIETLKSENNIISIENNKVYKELNSIKYELCDEKILHSKYKSLSKDLQQENNIIKIKARKDYEDFNIKINKIEELNKELKDYIQNPKPLLVENILNYVNMVDLTDGKEARFKVDNIYSLKSFTFKTADEVLNQTTKAFNKIRNIIV